MATVQKDYSWGSYFSTPEAYNATDKGSASLPLLVLIGLTFENFQILLKPIKNKNLVERNLFHILKNQYILLKFSLELREQVH